MKVKIIEEDSVEEVDIKEKSFEEYSEEYEGLVIKNILKKAFSDGMLTEEEYKYLEMCRMEKYDATMLKLMPN